MTFAIYTLVGGIFFINGFGRYIDKGSVDGKALLKNICIKLLALIVSYVVIQLYFFNSLELYLISILTTSVLFLLAYLWKYLRGFNF